MLVKMIEQGLIWDIEREIKPIWYLRVIKDALTGVETTVTARQMIEEAIQAKPARPADVIANDFTQLIERDRRADHG